MGLERRKDSWASGAAPSFPFWPGAVCWLGCRGARMVDGAKGPMEVH